MVVKNYHLVFSEDSFTLYDKGRLLDNSNYIYKKTYDKTY